MSFVKRAAQYADDVLDNKISACIYVKQACKRFIKDLQCKDIYLDIEEAERWCRNLERLPHVKGKWARKKELLKLSPYQIFITVNLYGWKKKKNNRRRFLEAYIEVPRKNGKTFWIAGIGIGGMAWDHEYGAEVYCGATTERQAHEVFTPAALICKRLPKLREKYGIEVHGKTKYSNISIASNGSKFEPLIGDPGDGSSPSLGIVDEYHEHKNSNLAETLTTGMLARENPLIIYITTAGSNTGGPCFEKRSEIIAMLKGSFDDDSIFGIIYTIDEGDRWDSEKSLIKANPNWGVSVDPEIVLAKLKTARRSATKQNSFKTKHLNMWVGAMSAWINMLAVQACRKKLNIEDFKGRKCFVGLDLASKIDIASMAIYFPSNKSNNKAALFCKHYLPENVIFDGENTMYKSWHTAGWIEATPGDIIDFDYIANDLRDLKSLCQIEEVAYDPFQATMFATDMTKERFIMIELGQTAKNMSEPMKELEADIIAKKIDINADPVLLWMFGNVVARVNYQENITPAKEFPKNKIDGVVAAIMAKARSMFSDHEPSMYESEGVRSL